MPTVPPGGKVLVTGITGFIACWVAKTLLERGYSVRGTARSEARAKFVRELFALYGEALEIVIVEDIAKEGAFDEAVKGVDGVEHIASPAHVTAQDPKEIIDPAVNGTLGILHSIHKHNPTLKRVVITSSCAAVLELFPDPKVFSESDWNLQAIKEVEKKGANADGMTKYRASKTLSEKAAWEFVNTYKDKITWDLTVLNPPFVFGPVIHEAATREHLNSSSAAILRILLTPSDAPTALPPGVLKSTGSCWVDVRDLAEAHVRALEIPEAGSERVIISAGPYVWQDWRKFIHLYHLYRLIDRYPVDAANTLTPPVSLPGELKVTGGVPGSGAGATHKIVFDNSKAAKVFGLRYHTMQETVRSVLDDIRRRGWS
ncbi:hypothetical protein ONZ45_g648 [Pleurotus djamor]|nr:hypothetical protein ONZ45_g648 [Pleurotus djamor]